ncbi:MAG: hypothetical protein RBR08_16195 [Desulforegulaceae bacterium]|nr:hypothetical protein [Desulforegulaceae bacterium]
MIENEKEFLIARIRESSVSFFYFENFYFNGLRSNREKKVLKSIVYFMGPPINVFSEYIHSYFLLKKSPYSDKVKIYLSENLHKTFLLLIDDPGNIAHMLSISCFINYFFQNTLSALESMEKRISSQDIFYVMPPPPEGGDSRFLGRSYGSSLRDGATSRL